MVYSLNKLRDALPILSTQSDLRNQLVLLFDPNGFERTGSEEMTI